MYIKVPFIHFKHCQAGCRDGRNGRDGKDGINGLDGKQGKPGRDGQDGRDGKRGENGLNGRDGVDGNCAPTNWKECAYKESRYTDIGIIKVIRNLFMFPSSQKVN